MKFDKLVYVAGPYTKPDPVENTRFAVRVADQFVNNGIAAFVPHLTMFWHFLGQRPYEQWLALDLIVLERCDALYRIPGESSGADREIARAEELGIPVYYSIRQALDVLVPDCELTFEQEVTDELSRRAWEIQRGHRPVSDGDRFDPTTVCALDSQQWPCKAVRP